jgi:hypothetical protein
MKKIIAVDFDGVLHDPDSRLPGYRMGQPVEGAVDAMRRLRDEDHTLIIHTVRDNWDLHVTKWLSYFRVPYHDVTNVKPNADVFIDDKAIRFTDWHSTLAQISASWTGP